MYYVFSDESGQSGTDYEDRDQPVLCHTAVIIDETLMPKFENETCKLLKKFNLPENQEIHAYPCISGIGGFQRLNKNQRHDLLKKFIHIGVNLVFKIHYIPMLKSFVKQSIRENAEKAGLDPFMITFMYLIIIIDKYFEHIQNENYKYFYDTTDNYRKKINKAIHLLKNIPQDSLRINNMIGNPEETDSKISRPIQLSDVIAYYLNRHRQLEVGTFKHRESLEKHRVKIFEIYDMIKPKFLKFIGNILPQKIDWEALQKFNFIKIK